MSISFQPTTKGTEIELEKEPRPRSDEGSVYKKVVERLGANGKKRKKTVYYARQRYTDAEGNRREKKRVCDSHADALLKLRELQDEIDDLLNPKPKEQSIEKIKFSDFADQFEKEFVKPAKIVKGKKIEGYKESLKSIRYQINLLRDFFGETPLDEILYDDIKKYKNMRLQVPVKKIVNIKIEVTEEYRKKHNLNPRQKFRYGKKEVIKEREYASVHRELSRLRTIFKTAIRQRKLLSNPFDHGESIIKKSLEVVRDRIISFEEENLLLANCTGKREHLKNIIILAVDSAMRAGEIFSLEWTDVDINQRQMRVRQENTKTEKFRIVPMTSRVVSILTELKKVSTSKFIFGIKSAQTAWENVIKATKIENLHFHDLRATGITRMLRAHIPQAEVMKISGHTELSTFMKYVRQDDEGASKIAVMMDNFLNSQKADAPNTPLRKKVKNNSKLIQKKTTFGKAS